jgi:hypothetical protein
MRVQQLAMARRFVVERKAFRVVADLDQAVTAGDEAQGHRRTRIDCRRRVVGRPQRIAPERMLDVGQQQLLVLLFVLQAQLHQRRQFGIRRACQSLAHGIIDVAPIGEHLVQ